MYNKTLKALKFTWTHVTDTHNTVHCRHRRRLRRHTKRYIFFFAVSSVLVVHSNRYRIFPKTNITTFRPLSAVLLYILSLSSIAQFNIVYFSARFRSLCVSLILSLSLSSLFSFYPKATSVNLIIISHNKNQPKKHDIQWVNNTNIYEYGIYNIRYHIKWVIEFQRRVSVNSIGINILMEWKK